MPWPDEVDYSRKSSQILFRTISWRIWTVRSSRNVGESGGGRRLSGGGYAFRACTDNRIGLGLTIHGAELTAFSGIAQGICAQTAGENSFNDSVFEAEDAETWRSLMKCVAEDEVLSDPPNTFLPTVLLSQSVVQVHMLRDFERTALVDDPPLRLLAGFYTYMTKLATRHNFLHVIQQPQDTRVSSSQRSLAVLWHYNCLVRLAPISQIEVAAGRVGPVADAGSVPAWVNTPPARLAALHCGSILYHAADLKDQGFLVPR